MTPSLDFRPYQAGDEHAILQLFEQTFGRRISLDSWNWRFRDNPTGDIMVELAWAGETLAAHYAVSPVPLTVSGEECLTALSMTTMTHPDYRGVGLFPALAARLYGRLAERGYLMVWGFPNDNSHRGFIRDLGWRDIYEIPMLRAEIARMRAIPPVSAQVVEVQGFDQRFDELWDRVRRDQPIQVGRRAPYLNWRFATNPQARYRIFVHEEHRAINGYVVLKAYGRESMDLVDFTSIRDDAVARALLAAAIDSCRVEGLAAINLWLPVRHWFHAELERIGFANTVPITYLGARTLMDSQPQLDLLDVRNWHYAMADSDVVGG